jgi:hypothetical protein
MRRADHSFDWRGVVFVAKIVLVLVGVSAVGHFGVDYLTSSLSTASTPEVMITQQSPLIPVANAATLSRRMEEKIYSHSSPLNNYSRNRGILFLVSSSLKGV